MPLREPDLISHGLYVWPLLPALRAAGSSIQSLHFLREVRRTESFSDVCHSLIEEDAKRIRPDLTDHDQILARSDIMFHKVSHTVSIKRETARWAVSPSFCIHQRIYGRTMVSTIAATRAMTITADTVFFCFGLIISIYLLKSVYLRFSNDALYNTLFLKR